MHGLVLTYVNRCISQVLITNIIQVYVRIMLKDQENPEL